MFRVLFSKIKVKFNEYKTIFFSVIIFSFICIFGIIIVNISITSNLSDDTSYNGIKTYFYKAPLSFKIDFGDYVFKVNTKFIDEVKKDIGKALENIK